MITGTATRLAGKALGDFLKLATSATSAAVEQKVLGQLASKYSPTVEKYAVYPARVGAEIIEESGKPAYSLQVDKTFPEAASTRIGKIITKLGPENIAKVAGAAAPIAALGGIAAGAGLVEKMFQDPENVYSQSQYTLPMRKMGTPVAYANQQYIPGMSPMTNQTVAEAMLEQQKFQHQLQLIDARQAAQQSVGIGGRTTGGRLDIMGLSQQAFAPVQY